MCCMFIVCCARNLVMKICSNRHCCRLTFTKKTETIYAFIRTHMYVIIRRVYVALCSLLYRILKYVCVCVPATVTLGWVDRRNVYSGGNTTELFNGAAAAACSAMECTLRSHKQWKPVPMAFRVAAGKLKARENFTFYSLVYIIENECAYGKPRRRHAHNTRDKHKNTLLQKHFIQQSL